MKQEIQLIRRWLTGRELPYKDRVEVMYTIHRWHIRLLAHCLRWLLLRMTLSEIEIQELIQKERKETKQEIKRIQMRKLISGVPENWTAKEFLPWYDQDIEESDCFDGELAFFVSPCQICAHLRSHEGTCAAYPDGIPLEIWLKLHDHQESYPGDNGIRFKLKDT
ncbi:MAG: hypothetical protein QM758_17520 [Armatimonas sp.]